MDAGDRHPLEQYAHSADMPRRAPGAVLRLSEGRSSAGVVVVSAAGELDVHGAPRLRELLAKAIEAGRERFIVDFEEVTFVDSVALAAVVAARRRLGDRGAIALVSSDSYVTLLMRAAGVLDVIPVCASRGEAERRALA
jgi:anti-sigma B factor antagonist